MNDSVWKHASRKTGWWKKDSGRSRLHIPEDTFQDASTEKPQDDDDEDSLRSVEERVPFSNLHVTMTDLTKHVLDRFLFVCFFIFKNYCNCYCCYVSRISFNLYFSQVL